MGINDGENKVRLFLSYGQKDAQTLAGKLRDDFENQGYQVWQDAERIKTGWSWSEEIKNGIKDSQVLIALLSPHAVRRAGMPGNPDNKDSVCLDEIHYALDQCNIPIVPVMVVTCEPPFRIFRLQYLDFRRWDESEAHYRALFERLRRDIDQAFATKLSPTREWGWLPEPWDFGSFLAERRKDFTGREWLYNKIENWRGNGKGSALLITGGPGVGKSAFVAELVHHNPGGHILAYHCCQADTPATLEPDRFVRSLAAMLSTRLEGYAEMLHHHDLQKILSETSTAEDPASAFEAGILNPLHKLPKPDDIRYILIDALDESLALAKGAAIVDLFATRLKRLPNWLKIIATTRSEQAVLNRLKGLQALTIDVEDPNNQKDIRDYITKRFAEPEIQTLVAKSGKSEKEVQDLLIRAGAGNFLIVTKVLEALAFHRLDQESIEKLPPGLGSLYQEFFDRLYLKADVDFSSASKVLQAIVTALEPPSRDEIAAFTGMDGELELPKVLGRLSSFVPYFDKSYRVFHKSLFEWLTNWDEASDQPTAGDYYISLKQGHSRWADLLWAEYQKSHDLPSNNVLLCLPAHLTGAARWDDLAQVLLDWRFLEAKVTSKATHAYNLLTDFVTAAEKMPKEHPRQRLIYLLSEVLRLDVQFIARHPSTLFQCCWNRGWWHDAPQAAHFYVEPGGGWPVTGPPWQRPGEKIHKFMEQWRAGKEKAEPGFAWLRLLRPPPEILESALRLIIYGHDDSLACVDVSPDGTRIVSADSKRFIKLWDARNGVELASNEYGNYVSGNGIQALKYHPSEDVIVGAHDDGHLIFFDPDTLIELARRKISHEGLNSLAISADGKRIASGDWGGRIRIFNAKTRKLICQVKGHEGTVECLAFSPHKSLLASGEARYGGGGDNYVRVWKHNDKMKLVAEFKSKHWVQDVCFSFDEGTVIWGDYEGNIEGRGLQTNNEWLLNDAAATETRQDSLALTSKPAGVLAMLPDGEHLLCGAGGAYDLASINLWNLKQRSVERKFSGHIFNVTDISILPGGRKFASAGDATVRIWDLDVLLDSVELRPSEPEVSHIIFSPDQPVVFTSFVKSETIWARSLEDGSVIARFDGHAGGVFSISLSPDGKLLACGAGDGTIRVWNTQTGKEHLSYHHHSNPVTALAFSPNGKLLASGARGAQVCIFDLVDRKFDASVRGLGLVFSAAFSADGLLLALGGYDQFLIWDAGKKKMITKPQTHSSPAFHSLCFTPDGRALIGQGTGESLTAWDSSSGEQIELTEEHRTTYLKSKYRFNRQWRWEIEEERKQNAQDRHYGFQQGPMILTNGVTGKPVAWLPMMPGRVDQWLTQWTDNQGGVVYLPTVLRGVDWHPTERIWTNRRSHQLWLFKLEGKH
jgi:WD40 repeat protein